MPSYFPKSLTQYLTVEVYLPKNLLNYGALVGLLSQTIEFKGAHRWLVDNDELVFHNDRFLFELGESYKEDMKEGPVSEKLKRKFEDYNCLLNNATISKEDIYTVESSQDHKKYYMRMVENPRVYYKGRSLFYLPAELENDLEGLEILPRMKEVFRDRGYSLSGTSISKENDKYHIGNEKYTIEPGKALAVYGDARYLFKVPNKYKTDLDNRDISRLEVYFKNRNYPLKNPRILRRHNEYRIRTNERRKCCTIKMDNQGQLQAYDNEPVLFHLCLEWDEALSKKRIVSVLPSLFKEKGYPLVTPYKISMDALSLVSTEDGEKYYIMKKFKGKGWNVSRSISSLGPRPVRESSKPTTYPMITSTSFGSPEDEDQRDSEYRVDVVDFCKEIIEFRQDIVNIDKTIEGYSIYETDGAFEYSEGSKGKGQEIPVKIFKIEEDLRGEFVKESHEKKKEIVKDVFSEHGHHLPSDISVRKIPLSKYHWEIRDNTKQVRLHTIDAASSTAFGAIQILEERTLVIRFLIGLDIDPKHSLYPVSEQSGDLEPKKVDKEIVDKAHKKIWDTLILIGNYFVYHLGTEVGIEDEIWINYDFGYGWQWKKGKPLREITQPC